MRVGSGGGSRGALGEARVLGPGQLCWWLSGRMMGWLTCGRWAVSDRLGGGRRAVSDNGGDGRVASVSDNPGDATLGTVSVRPRDGVLVSNKSGAVSDEPDLGSNKSGAVSDRSGDTVLVSNKSGSGRRRVR